MAALEAVMRIRLLLLAAVLSASPLAGIRAQQGPKVLLLYDMEGVTDATGPQDVGMGSQTYPATRESLTEDVNAAIRGLFKAGAREIVLTDGHGSGNPDPDYLLAKLPQGTRFDIRAVMVTGSISSHTILGAAVTAVVGAVLQRE
jgi:D-aminopeptidase